MKKTFEQINLNNRYQLLDFLTNKFFETYDFSKDHTNTFKLIKRAIDGEFQSLEQDDIDFLKTLPGKWLYKLNNQHLYTEY